MTRWSTGKTLFSSKDEKCVALSIRTYAQGAEGFTGYPLSVVKGKISDLEGAIVVPILALIFNYFDEMLDIVKVATREMKDQVKEVTEAYEKYQREAHTRPPRM